MAKVFTMLPEAEAWELAELASSAAEVWIEDLERHNRDYYEDRLAAYRKTVRDQMAGGGKALETLHASALAALERLRDRGVGLVILDECHHLMGHWGRVLADARGLLDEPIILGLTATPPDRTGKPPEDVDRYDAFWPISCVRPATSWPTWPEPIGSSSSSSTGSLKPAGHPTSQMKPKGNAFPAGDTFARSRFRRGWPACFPSGVCQRAR